MQENMLRLKVYLEEVSKTLRNAHRVPIVTAEENATVIVILDNEEDNHIKDSIDLALEEIALALGIVTPSKQAEVEEEEEHQELETEETNVVQLTEGA